MALTKGTNSWVTAAEADTYFEDRSQEAEWLAAGAVVQEQALVTAFYTLNALSWVGYAASETQNTAFPRHGAYYDPTYGRVITFSDTATEAPNRVKRGQYEMALHIVLNSGVSTDTGRVSSLNAGSVSLTTISPPSRIPFNVEREIGPLLQGGGSSGLSRVN